MCMSFLRIHVYPVLALRVHVSQTTTIRDFLNAFVQNIISDDYVLNSIKSALFHRKQLLAVPVVQLLIHALLHAITAASAKVEHVYADLDFQQTIVRTFRPGVPFNKSKYNADYNHPPVPRT
ncbi:hypothetical protein DPMN_093073 [Dreissena polymorpha]|uniref:Uncharacterized protein n=1 Tax=Dreissena polymorpha TaxID=45954 RepID=A0A9D4R1G5_DREPO|nr:hypothetical protein DPMN_093073 [Dreissena polymorpha]